MRIARLPLILLLCMQGCAGCGSRTIFVAGDSPVRLAEDAHVCVYVKDPNTGEEVRDSTRSTIPAGYVAFPPQLLRPATKPAH